MVVRTLQITSFRNIDSAQLCFDERVNVLFGRNASGKTNILEAIFVLLLGRSLRRAPHAVMMRDSADFYRVGGQVESGNKSDDVAVAYQRNGGKKIFLNNSPVRASELFNRFTVVSAGPEDTNLLAGSPSGRREFINIYLSQASKRYIADLSDYMRALIQKNAFLKQQSQDEETPYNELMIKHGVSVMTARHTFLGEIGSEAAAHYQKISGGHPFSVKYKPSVGEVEDLSNPQDLERVFREKLNKLQEREKVLQTSLVGPHRDEVELFIGDFPARTHASQGELRTASIALKLAVFDYLKKVKEIIPILLLDEIFAELDSGRKEMLVEHFGQFGQLFLTTASSVPGSLREGAAEFRIEKGTVIRE
jgi:DNA replication and repair protein RecF